MLGWLVLLSLAASFRRPMEKSSGIDDLPHILCVGLSTIDCIATADHFPTPDEKMRSQRLQCFGGGNAANTACGIGKQSDIVQCSLLTGVGDDVNGKLILQSLRNDFQVNTDLCQTYDGPTPFSYILVVGDTRTCIHQPAIGDVTVEHVETVLPDSVLQRFIAVHFDARYPKAALALAERCRKLNIPYSLDVERPRKGLERLLEGASIVVTNEKYCNSVIGQELSVDVKLEHVMKMQAPNAVYAIQTMGARGSCLVRLQPQYNETQGGRTIVLPGTDLMPCVERHGNALFCGSFSVATVVDTTGAGDAFQAGLYSALWSITTNSWQSLDDASLGRLLRIASRFASQKVQKPGARDGLPSFATDAILQGELSILQRGVGHDQ